MPIINRRGQLYSRSSFNELDEDGYDIYQLVEAPPLRWSKYIDSEITITEDGRLYDTFKTWYITEEYQRFPDFKQVYSSQFMGSMVLDIEGNLYNIEGDKLEILDKNVDWIIEDEEGDNYIIGNRIYSNRDYSEEIKLEDDEHIVGVSYQCIITNHRVIALMGTTRSSYPITGRLIGCALTAKVIDNNDNRDYELLVIEEIDGKIITSYSNDSLMYRNDSTIHRNRILEQIHLQSPWTDMIFIEGKPHLLNKDGMIVEIGSEWSINTTDIPLHIFADIQLKNARTK